jgi:hypothetical protein
MYIPASDVKLVLSTAEGCSGTPPNTWARASPAAKVISSDLLPHSATRPPAVACSRNAPLLPAALAAAEAAGSVTSAVCPAPEPLLTAAAAAGVPAAWGCSRGVLAICLPAPQASSPSAEIARDATWEDTTNRHGTLCHAWLHRGRIVATPAKNSVNKKSFLPAQAPAHKHLHPSCSYLDILVSRQGQHPGSQRRERLAQSSYHLSARGGTRQSRQGTACDRRYRCRP